MQTNQVIGDFHIHSRFSRATSHDITIANLEKWAKVKGIGLLGTGDFSHPEWFKEIKKELHEQNGILKTKNDFQFILSNEISLMYTQDGKGRRIHLVFLAPSLEVVEQITSYLGKKGRLDYDGRPIFNIPCDVFAEEMMKISEDIEIIPAHAWTPWFGIFGSATGFDSIEEAFKDKSNAVHSFETGMSSDPEMNWRLSKLDKYAVVSFSDAHSHWPWRIGREATVFNLQENFSYKDVIESIREKKIDFTIETSPSYGKYHYDGHRLCGFSCSPEEAKKIKNICPVCKKPLTIGVLNRVEELADRDQGFKPQGAGPFKTLLPLHELLATVLGSGISSKKVWDEYNLLINKFHDEFNILLNVPAEELRKAAIEKIVKIIIKNREGKLKVKPGFDGQYGVIVEDEQKKLF